MFVWAPRWDMRTDPYAEYIPWRAEFSRLLAVDREWHYCKRCVAAQERGDVQRALDCNKIGLWCVKCNTRHLRVLFEPIQRQAYFVHRVCRAHELSVRLCEHATMPCSFTQRRLHSPRIQPTAPLNGRLATGLIHAKKHLWDGWRLPQCADVRGAVESRSWRMWHNAWANVPESRVAEPRLAVRKYCWHGSHGVFVRSGGQGNKTTDEASDRRIFDTLNPIKRLRGKIRPLADSSSEPVIDGIYPVAIEDKDSRFVELFWAGHMFDLDKGVPVTRTLLRAKIAAIKPTDSTRMGICPHIARNFADGQLALPFEHGRCVCFDHNGRAPIASGHASGTYHNHPSIDDACCRCIARHTGSIRQPGVFMPSSDGEWTTFDGSRRTTPTLKGPLTEDFLIRRHRHRCSLCNASYTWVRKGHEMHLEVRRHVRINNTHTAALSWLRATDPATWGLELDRELSAAFWCNDLNCKTNDRYSALARYIIDL